MFEKIFQSINRSPNSVCLIPAEGYCILPIILFTTITIILYNNTFKKIFNTNDIIPPVRVEGVLRPYIF